MTGKWLLLAVSCLVLGMASIPSLAAPLQIPSGYDVVNAVNALRASHGMDPYQIDGLLMLAAQAQADYLASGLNTGNCHDGPCGTDADARAIAVGYPYVQGLDINENCACLMIDQPIESLFSSIWSDSQHMHTMLHPRGQHAGAGVAQNSSQIYIILDVAAYWGDAGLTPQPVNAAYGLNAATQIAISQYIAPVVKAKPAADGSITHMVQSGQSLWMLAHHYGVTIDQLRELNGLGTSDMIYVGQKILIQLPSPVTPIVVSDHTTLLPTQTMRTTQTPVLYFTQYATEMQREAPTPQADSSGWYVLFFTLFGLGMILVVVGITGHRA